jgi:hypothetical protein
MQNRGDAAPHPFCDFSIETIGRDADRDVWPVQSSRDDHRGDLYEARLNARCAGAAREELEKFFVATDELEEKKLKFEGWLVLSMLFDF